jgi:hypothetical protein
MIRLKFLAVFFTAALLAFNACNKDAGTGIDNRDPALSVSVTDMVLTGSPRYDIVQIANAGGGQLKWDVVEQPDWINLSDLVGRVTEDTFALKLTTNFGKLVYGSYDGVIKITSNGGDATIAVHLVYKAPALGIDIPVINMDRHYNYSQLQISNIGGGELTWQITQAPEWLKFDVTEGSVFGRPEYIPYRARLSTLNYGSYEENVDIVSNGGEKQIKVYLTYEREVEVYPSIGAANIDLGDTYTMVQNKLGPPDRNWYERPEKTVFIHHFTYDDFGLHFSVTTNSMILYGSGKVSYIEVYAPYDGMTPELIGVGSSTADLIAAYGQPTAKNGNQWYYASGITYEISTDKVSGMIIKD